MHPDVCIFTQNNTGNNIERMLYKRKKIVDMGIDYLLDLARNLISNLSKSLFIISWSDQYSVIL